MINWQRAWQLFEQSLKLQARAAKTCLAYQRDIAYLEKISGITSPTLIQSSDIEHMIAKLRLPLSSKSIGRMLSAWRGFFACLVDHGQVATNCCDHIRVPHRGKRLPKALSVDTTQHLLNYPYPSHPLYWRDHALFELMYSSGLRLNEAVMLNVSDIDLIERLVRVVGKGNKERLLPIGRCAMEALKQYLLQRVPDKAGAALFTSQSGYRLSGRQIQYRLTRWARLSALAQHVSPHMLRHSFASHLLQSSGDLRAVQEMLGHVNLSSTQIYTRLDYQHLSKTYDVTHPRAKLNKKFQQ